MKKNKLSLYALDKKICTMIVDIQKLSDDLGNESNNLFATSEEYEELEGLKEDFKALYASGRELIAQLFLFKHKLNEYQFKRSQTQMNELCENFGKTKESREKELEKAKEDASYLADFMPQNSNVHIFR